MIVDRIENIAQYLPMLHDLDKVADFVNDFYKAPKAGGRYEIDGNRVYANVSTYETKDRAGAQFEAHKKYVDLQAVIAGEEAIGWAALNSGTLTETSEEYSKGGDIAFYTGDGVMDAILPAGYFALLFPEDAHMPCLYTGKDRKVTKIVVKIEL